MVGYYSQGVPTTAELENNTNQKKYTVNGSPKGYLAISRPVCALFVMGAILMAAVAAVVTFLLLPRCDSGAPPEPFTKTSDGNLEDEPIIVSEYARLPRNVQPTQYRLYIRPFLDGNFSTNGNVTIKLKVHENTNKIVLNAKDLKIGKESVKLKKIKDDKFVKIKEHRLDSDNELLVLEVGEKLTRDEHYELMIEFTGKLNDNLIGFYRSKYSDMHNQTRWLASTQFSPTDARRAFPCFDEPAFKSKYTISIARPAHLLSLSNMPRKDSLMTEGNMVWDNFNETPPISSYLVAFTVHDFLSYKHNISDRITVWSRSDRINQASFSISIAPQILQFFEYYFDIKYPLPKLDVMALPDFGFSAMENWGLINFRETKLLFDEKSSTVQNKRDIATTISHELAHQWFGNLVTPKWWDDLWLKEGFASYFQYLGINHVEPSWKIMDEFYFSETMEAFKIDRLKTSRPIHFNVQDSNNIRQAFDAISYSKGASLIKMMINFLGETTFKEGLKKFLKKYQYSNADHDDLWNVLTEQARIDSSLDSNVNVKDVMTTWIKQAGFPLLTVTANYVDNTLHITQNRFLLYDKPENSSKWWIPITYITSDNPNFNDNKPKIWLKNEAETVIKTNLSEWYLLNMQQSGYYVVNYDERNWIRLVEYVMSFPPVTRAQLVSDSMDLARAGLLDYEIPLKLITIIGKRDLEISFIPYITTFAKLTFLHNILQSTPIYDKFETYIESTFRFAFENINFDESPNENYIQQRIRRTVLEQACRKQESGCSLDSRIRYRKWMTTGYHISPNVRETLYCTAIRDGGNAEWDFAYQEYVKTNSASDKTTLLKAMGCSSKHWLLSRYLDLLLKNNSGIRKQDGADVFISVARNINGHNLAFDFLRNNWDKINKYYGEAFRTVSKMVEDTTTYMNTPVHLQQLETFKKENKYNLKANEQAFDNAIDTVKANIQWMKTNYKSIETWISSQFARYH